MARSGIIIYVSSKSNEKNKGVRLILTEEEMVGDS